MYISPTTGYTSFPTTGSKKILVPCGKCDACLLAKARDWSVRASVEIDNPLWHGKGLFLTLTVRNEDMEYQYALNQDSSNGSTLRYTLSTSRLQKFIKRLRKAFPQTRLAYLACGEYGGRTHRPHYHMLVYGLNADDFGDFQYLKRSGSGHPLYISRKLDKIWSHGICFIGNEVRHEVAGYIARYTFKKRGFSKFDKDGVLPPFQTFSKNIPIIGHSKWRDKDGALKQVPLTAGIGGNFFAENVAHLLSNNFIRSRDDARIKLPLPRAFLHMASELFPSNKFLYDEIRKTDLYCNSSVAVQSTIDPTKKISFNPLTEKADYGTIPAVESLIIRNENEIANVLRLLNSDESFHDKQEGVNYDEY